MKRINNVLFMIRIISSLGLTSGQTLPDNVSGTVDKESTFTASSKENEVVRLQVNTEFIDNVEVSPAVLYEGVHVRESKPEVDTSLQNVMVTVKQGKHMSGANKLLKDDSRENKPSAIEASLQNMDGQETSRYLQENELEAITETFHIGRKKPKHAKNTKSNSLKNKRGNKKKENKKKGNKSKYIPLSSPTSVPVSPKTYTPVKSTSLSSPTSAPQSPETYTPVKSTPLSFPTSAPQSPQIKTPVADLSSVPSSASSSDDGTASDDYYDFGSDDYIQSDPRLPVDFQSISDDGSAFASDDDYNGQSLNGNFSPECVESIEDYSGKCTGICKPNLVEFRKIVKTLASSSLLYDWFRIFPFVQDFTESAFSDSIESKWSSYKEVPSSTASYLLCNSTPNLSGYQRSLRITRDCNIQNFEENPTINDFERTCYTAMLDFTSAHYCCTRPNMLVVPYTQWSKMSVYSVMNAFKVGNNFSNLSTDLMGGESKRIGSSWLIQTCDPKNKGISNVFLKEEWDNIEECRDLPSFGNLVKFDEKDSSLHLRDIGDLFISCKMNRNFRTQTDRNGCVTITLSCLLEFLSNISSSQKVCGLEDNSPIDFDDVDPFEILEGINVLSYHNDVAFLHEKGIKGQGQVAQISDSGVKVDNCYFSDQNGIVNRDTSKAVDSSKRKIIQYYTASTDNTDAKGHGTHVAGIIVGQIENAANSDKDGVAPEAKLAVYDMHGLINSNQDAVTSPNDYAAVKNMLDMGTTAGAYVHSASWVKTGRYLNNYKQLDRDIDKYLWNNHNHLVILSAGNKGKKEGDRSVKHVGKNLICVCNAISDYYVNSKSSRGPTDSGQIKPDICALGTNIRSAGVQTCDQVDKSGTSMAAPALAGVALLIRQYFMEGWYPLGRKAAANAFVPSGYLVKAIIMNSGKVLSERNDPGNGPSGTTEYDEIQGFGLVSLTDGIFISGKSDMKGMQVFDRKVLTDAGSAWEKTLTIDSVGCASSYSSITLDYYDKPASVSCTSCRMNHLDLSVKKGSTVYYPNGLAQVQNKNTSQRIRIENYNNGDTFVVKVKATSLESSDQKFAVVITGCFGWVNE
eukprot:CAMPEP_0194311020 /NCGR_PEP_ID=MMETSP0171-20130528/7991_1 /TAXON_ID=218684 /ORGANISM="Corethron pennatum, Strain L29A3" /LENGTH=1079 /DNA_ID=CAMNT_0039064933 /DNA_START=256 /DNA_END=3498 /DNA_ORIENTATION=+